MTYMDNSPYVMCEDLFKIYKIADLEVVALRGLDLAVQNGEVVAIVGASGSGEGGGGGAGDGSGGEGGGGGVDYRCALVWPFTRKPGRSRSTGQW